jgi:hypothetical protein
MNVHCRYWGKLPLLMAPLNRRKRRSFGTISVAKPAMLWRRFRSSTGSSSRFLRTRHHGFTVVIVENHVQQGTVNVQVISGVIINKAELAEPIHEEADARPGCAHHLRQSLLAQPRNRHFGHPFLAEVRHQEKDSSQALLAGIEKLINQVILIPDVPLQEVFDE